MIGAWISGRLCNGEHEATGSTEEVLFAVLATVNRLVKAIAARAMRLSSTLFSFSTRATHECLTHKDVYTFLVRGARTLTQIA